MRYLILIFFAISCSRDNTITTARQSVGWHIQFTGSSDATGKTMWLIDTGIDTTNTDLNIGRFSRSFVGGSINDNPSFPHGTNTAGACARNNTVQALGVACNATIQLLKIDNGSGIYNPKPVLSALQFVQRNAKMGDVVVIEYQFLTAKEGVQANKIIQAICDRGIKVFTPAGNQGILVTTYPQNLIYPNFYVVGGVDNTIRTGGTNKWIPANFGGIGSTVSTNYGNSVKWAAPAVEILTTCYQCPNDWTASSTGTSMAATLMAAMELNGGWRKIDSVMIDVYKMYIIGK